MSQTDWSGPSSEGPDSSSASQRAQILEALKASDRPLTDEEIGEKLQIKYCGPRLIELFDDGIVEPLPKKRKKDRQRWQVVAAERRAEVKKTALGRRKTSLLRTVSRQPVWLQGWVVRRVLAPTHPKQLELLQQDCPGELQMGECNCPTPNVWLQRHDKKKRNKPISHARREASRLAAEVRTIVEEVKRAEKEDPPMVQFLKDKQQARHALEIVAYLKGQIEDEVKLRKQYGEGDITEANWKVMRAHVSELQDAIAELAGALISMLEGEDFIDAPALDAWGYPEDYAPAAELEGQLLEFDIVDAEIVEDD